MAAPFVQQVAYNTTAASDATTIDVTFGSAPATDALVVVFAASNVDYSGMGISDNQSNSYTSRAQSGYADTWCRSYTAPAVNTQDPFTVTVTQSAGRIAVIMAEVRGYYGASPIDLSDNAWGTINGGFSPYSPMNMVATNYDEELFLAVLSRNYTGGTISWVGDTGWTTEHQYNGSVSQKASLISLEVTSIGTYDPTWVGGVGSENSAAIGISIRAGSTGLGGGGGGGVPKSTKFFLLGVG